MSYYKSHILFAATLIAVCVVVILAGCSSKSQSVAPGNRKVVLQLNWTADPTFTGEFIAKHKGYWRDRGLDVDIRVAGPGLDPVAAVISKKADFAVVGADKAVIAFSNGADVRVIAVDFQRNPVGWIVRSKHNISCFRDIVKHKDIVLGDKVGSETTAILKVCLQRSRISDKLNPTGVGWELPYFIQRPNLVYPVYLNEEPVRVAAQGVQITEIDPADEANGAVKMYGNVIIARRDFIDENPKSVEALVSGLRAGWKYARDNEADAASIIGDAMKDYDKDSLMDVMKRSVDFATNYYGTNVEPCHMEVEAWKNTIGTLAEGGVIEKPIELQKLVWFGGE